jgi:hypothetical protein
MHDRQFYFSHNCLFMSLSAEKDVKATIYCELKPKVDKKKEKKRELSSLEKFQF